jgi:hypothetical protein
MQPKPAHEDTITTVHQDRREEMVGSRSIRRALVLEGGGAKGAYALGALLAFRQVGLNFESVAGYFSRGSECRSVVLGFP